MKKLWLCLLLVLLTGCSASKSEPQPTCGPYGPPWIWKFENLDAAKNFIKAAETLETCARWIEDNAAVHAGLLSDPERAARIAEDLRNVPIPTMAAELPMEVYPDFDRRFVAIMYREEEKLFRATISMDTKSVEAEKYGRLIETNNFDVLYDQNDVSAEMNYAGQVNGCRISISLEGYGEEEALRFVKSLEFETLSEENKAN